MKKQLFLLLGVVFHLSLYAQTNFAVHIDGKDNNLRIGMDSICRNWTLEAWIKPDDDVWKEQEVIIGGGEYSKLNSLDYLPLIIKKGYLYNFGADLTGCKLPVNQWSHVAATCNGTSIKLYLNGEEVAHKDTATVILPGAIGINESSNSIFGGLIDEVRIWTTGLTKKELKAWMYRPLTNRHPQFDKLKGYYNFDDLSDDISLNRAAEGRMSFHIRNGRLKQYEKQPLAYIVENDNKLFHTDLKKQKLFKTVVLPTEWDAQQGEHDFQLLKLKIETQGKQNPKSVRELTLDFSTCSSLADIERIHVYNAGSKPHSETLIELIEGGLQVKSSKITIQLPKNEFTQLKHGTNYILITADIAADASLGNRIEAYLKTVKINNKYILPIHAKDCLPIAITTNSYSNPKVLRVLQWNIWHGGNHLGKNGPERIINLIKHSNADIITMQEGYGSQKKIADALGFYLQTPSLKDNLCLYSRYPLKKINTKNKFFSNPAFVQMPNGKEIYVNGCWLRYAHRPAYASSIANYGMKPSGWVAEDSILGLVDIQRLIENDLSPYISESTPIIIGGDFNSGSHLDWTHKAAPLHFGYVAEELPISRYMQNNGFKDTFREIYPNEVERGEGTFAVIYGQSQTSRIDFIYSKGKNLRHLSSKIVRTMPEIDDVWPSDHAAVLTAFVIE